MYKTIKKNKKAYLDYEIIESFIFWIKLKGFEVKQIRTWNIDLRNAFCHIQNQELYIHELNIPLYEKTSSTLVIWYDPKRKRKLLATRKEIQKITERTHKTWFTIIALEVGQTKKYIKVKCALSKLRRNIEKKQIIKEKDISMQMQKDIKNLKY